MHWMTLGMPTSYAKFSTMIFEKRGYSNGL